MPKGMTRYLKDPYHVAKSSLPFMARHDAHIVVTDTQVNFGEDLCRTKAVKEVANER